MTKLVLPTPEQVEWADCELGVIIHLDLPVFSGENYDFRKHFGDPLPASIFAPDALDTDQWVRAAADMGAKYAVLVAKHCTGFCLWPTDVHGYSVKNTPYKGGHGDIVGDFFASCQKYGLRPGLYYSASCNQFMNVDNPGRVRSGDPAEQKAYNDMVIAQLTELWTRYGQIFEIWFDGGCLPVEQGGPDIASLLHRLQPNAVVFQGPRGTRSLLRWTGNERGVADKNCSAIFNFSAQAFDGTKETGDLGNTMGDTWCPAESDLPNRDARSAWQGGWFWREGEEHTIKIGEMLFDTYLQSVGRGTNMLVGMVIDTHGRFPEADEKAFRRFAQLRRAAFDSPLAEGRLEGACCRLTVPEGRVARWLDLGEDIAQGERVTGYRLTGRDADGRDVFHDGGRIISHRRIVPIASDVRVLDIEITECKAEPVLTHIALY